MRRNRGPHERRASRILNDPALPREEISIGDVVARNALGDLAADVEWQFYRVTNITRKGLVGKILFKKIDESRSFDAALGTPVTWTDPPDGDRSASLTKRSTWLRVHPHELYDTVCL